MPIILDSLGDPQIVDWSSLYIHILPEAPGCTDAMANRALRAAAREFCQATKAHKLDLTPFAPQAATATYALTGGNVPAQTEVFGIDSAYLGTNTRLFELDREELKLKWGWDWKERTGTPQNYLIERQGVLRLVPYPEETLTETVKLECVLRPTRLSTGLTDWIGEEYGEKLAAGALAIILNMPPAPQPQLAAAKRMEFQSAMGAAQMAVFKGKVRSRVRTRAYFS